MEETDDFIDTRETASQAAAEERNRLQRAFGDDVAQRFLRLRGIEGDAMQEAVLEKYAAKQALRMARDALALAATQQAPTLFTRAPAPTHASVLREDEDETETISAGGGAL